jgi:flagellar biosynthetic protein FlhB
MPSDSEDRTLAASARRLQKAREEGDIPVSRELTLLAGLAGGGAALAIQIGAAGGAPLHWFAGMLQRAGAQGAGAVAVALHGVVSAVAPAAFGAVAAVLGVGAVQTGFLLRGAVLQPDLGRISPARGIKRLFSVETLVQAGKSLVKLAVFSAALWMALRRLLAGISGTAGWSAAGLLQRLVAESERLALVLVGAQVALAGFDFAWVRLQHARRMRMSRQDQRDEHKEAEGNPLMRQRLRQLGRARAKRRMMAAVKRAAVVVTNPSHYAVALEYRRGSRAAPRVVAKGVDDIAQRIREEAVAHRIPVVANPPLARALYRIELDSEIPVEHFKAVAEIVAYVWRMRTRPPL